MRLNGGIRFSRRPAGRNQPPSVLETRQFPPTVLLKSGAQPGKGCPVISRLGRGAEPGKHLFGIGIVVGAQAGVESSARDQGRNA